MALVNPKEIFEKAWDNNYAIGAFNVNNMEIIQGIVAAAKQESSSVILQVSAGARKYAGPIYIRKLVEAAVEEYPEIPLILHLDHGQDFEICKACIDAGFTSVMIDASHFSFEENIRITSEVVKYAQDKGVFVEAELGQLAGIEEDVQAEHSVFTDPDQAVEFVERTGCNSLAVAIGTSHGAYKFTTGANLDFERLEKITTLLPKYPLVLHGASSVLKSFVDTANQYGASIKDAAGLPEEFLRKATTMGVCKINIDTDIRLAVTATIRESLAINPTEFDPRSYLKPAREAVKNMVAHKIKHVLGSANTI